MDAILTPLGFADEVGLRPGRDGLGGHWPLRGAALAGGLVPYRRKPSHNDLRFPVGRLVIRGSFPAGEG